MSDNTELMQKEEETGLFIQKRAQAYCSLKPKTEEEKISFFNLINSPQKRLKDNINIPIEVANIYAERISLIDADGVLTDCVRIILITPQGEGYACVSSGVFSALQKIIGIFGEPSTWKKPIKVVPKLINKSADRSILTLELTK